MSTRPVDAPRATLPSVGDVLEGKIRLERVLGEGGMGVVFAGRHLVLERAVAVKFVRPEAMRSPQARARFLREARVCADVRHPNVIDVHDCGEFGDAAYLVMPLLHGESLAQRLTREGALPPDVATSIAAQALDGLHAAHLRGVVHRDVKPDNIFLEQTERGAVAVVLDFGIAHAAGEADPLTHEGSLLGTPAFMSPEQARGEVDLTPAADVYSVGATLYQMLAGEKPFPQRVLLPLLEAVRQHRYEPLDRRAPSLPAELVAAVHRAMSLDPAARFASAADFAASLRALALSPSPSVTPPTPPRVTPPEARPSTVSLPVATSAPLTAPRAPWPRSIAVTAALSVVAGSVLGLALRTRIVARTAPHTAPRTSTVMPSAPPSPIVVTAPPTAPAAPHADPSLPAATVWRSVVVRSEDGATVTARGTHARGVARVARDGDLAQLVLRVPAGTEAVCCVIPHEARPVCRPIRWTSEGGHVDCFAD